MFILFWKTENYLHFQKLLMWNNQHFLNICDCCLKQTKRSFQNIQRKIYKFKSSCIILLRFDCINPFSFWSHNFLYFGHFLVLPNFNFFFPEWRFVGSSIYMQLPGVGGILLPGWQVGHQEHHVADQRAETVHRFR